MFQATGPEPGLKWQSLASILRQSYPNVTGMLDVACRDALGTLVLTLLSQSTTDRQAQAAYASLRKAFPRWEQVLAAKPRDVAEHIKAGGLNQQKAVRIQAILARLQDEAGALSLAWLAKKSPAAAREFLLSLPGVGPKTAACVLLFSFDMPALPVDTHVARLSRRLGLVSLKASPAQIQQELEAMVPPEAARHFHLALIEHGRAICRPRRPRCDDCRLASACEYGKESLPR